jgi:hypothetical protein
MITNIEQFVEHIPTASGSEFGALEPYVNESKDLLKLNLLGADLYNKIDGLQVSDTAYITLARLVCAMAYKNAIPFVDLVQTANGFAVVSNGNLAPASKERVERLIEWLTNQIDTTTDLLINQVMVTSALLTEWKKFNRFNDLTSCFFVTGNDYSVYCKVDKVRKRELFEQNKPQMLAWQENVLAPVISKSYLSQLITENRNQIFTTGAPNVINYCKLILGALHTGDVAQVDKLLNTVATVLEKSTNTYTTYAASDEYKLKTAAKYENKADHPTFFFGL